MKVGNIIAIGKTSKHWQLVNIKRGNLSNTFVLRDMLKPNEIVEVGGHILLDGTNKRRRNCIISFNTYK